MSSLLFLSKIFQSISLRLHFFFTLLKVSKCAYKLHINGNAHWNCIFEWLFTLLHIQTAYLVLFLQFFSFLLLFYFNFFFIFGLKQNIFREKVMRFSKRFARVSGLEKALNWWVGWLVGWWHNFLQENSLYRPFK